MKKETVLIILLPIIVLMIVAFLMGGFNKPGRITGLEFPYYGVISSLPSDGYEIERDQILFNVRKNGKQVFTLAPADIYPYSELAFETNVPVLSTSKISVKKKDSGEFTMYLVESRLKPFVLTQISDEAEDEINLMLSDLRYTRNTFEITEEVYNSNPEKYKALPIFDKDLAN